MEASNRILTVSYGTFSCSLEGFDDPFTTLQMVAEYFRKLSTEDRFFGGEPQVPDNTTIHKIAEATNPNRVDAEIRDSGIVLRQKPKDTSADLDLRAEPARSAIGDSAPDKVFDRTDRPKKADPELRKAEKKRKNKAKGKNKRKHRQDDAGVFRSRRHGSESGSEDTGSGGSSEIDVPQKSVEETLAKIRVNVEKAEKDIIRSEAEDAKQSAPTLQLDKTMVAAPVFEATIPVETPADTPPAPEAVELPAAEEVIADVVETVEETAVPEHDSAASEENEIIAESDNTTMSAFDEQAEVPEGPEADSTTLSAEAEADLAAALGVVQEDEPESTDQDEDVDTPEATVEEVEGDAPDKESAIAERRRLRRERAAALRTNSDVIREDEALDRLLQTTNSQMDGPERMRRRNALDQLKAAVAATEAEKSAQDQQIVELGTQPQDVDDLAVYREDLKRAQRKSNVARPSGRRSAPSASAAPAPTPLILVSEQRIDEPESDDLQSTPTEHREVAEIDGNLALKPQEDVRISEDASPHGIPASAFKESTTFRDFADQINAVTLQDMLEAAAAYTSIVEGRPRFSRAQVMSKLAKISTNDAFSKEAGLRSFGKLLREGKILRVQDGQFAISKSSRFSIASRYGT